MNTQTVLVVDGSFEEGTKIAGIGMTVWDGKQVTKHWDAEFVYGPYSQLAEYKAVLFALNYIWEHNILSSVVITDQKYIHTLLHPSLSLKKEHKKNHWTHHPEIKETLLEIKSKYKLIQRRGSVAFLHPHQLSKTKLNNFPKENLHNEAHRLSRMYKTHPSFQEKIKKREMMLSQKSEKQSFQEQITIGYLERLSSKQFLYSVAFGGEKTHLQLRSKNASYGLLLLGKQYRDSHPSATITLNATERIHKDIPVLQHVKSKNKYHILLETVLQEENIKIKKDLL